MSIFRAWAALTIVLGIAAPGGSSTWQQEPQVPRDFIARVNQYVEMHRLVTAPLGLLEVCSDPEELLRQQRAFARAIREGRPNAREGDIFTADAARYFRSRVAEVAWQRGLDLIGDVEDAAEWDTEAVVVEVNTPIPWHAGPMMWPSVLSRLPDLPLELEYRFVGRDLLLVDLAGNTVVDVLREALPIYERSESS